MYKYRSSPSLGEVNIGSEDMCAFNLVKASSHSVVQVILPLAVVFRSWKNGLHLSAVCDMKRLSALIRPFNLCTSLIVRGLPYRVSLGFCRDLV